MKTMKFGTALLAFGMLAGLASCDSHKDESPVGKWTSSAPEVVTANVAGASSATQTLSIEFVAPVSDEKSGDVIVSADYDVKGESATDSVGTYTATATIKGTWSQDLGEHDEYLLTFDKNTLSVSGVDAPGLGAVTDAFLGTISKFTKLDDVEVSKDGSHLKFETKHPEVKYQFVKE